MKDDADSLFRVRWWEAALVILIGLAQAAAMVAFTLLMRSALQALAPTTVGAAAEAIRRNALIQVAWMLALAVVLGILRSLEFGLSERAGYQVVRRLRMAMYGHLQGMTPDQLRNRARGGLLLRLTGDLSMLRMWLSRGRLVGMVALITLATGLGVVVWLNRWMGLAVVFAFALTALLSLLEGRPMRRATRTMRRRRSLVIGNIDEQISSIATVQMGARTRGEYERLSRQNDALTVALNKVAWLRGRLRGVAFGGSLLNTVLVVGIGLIEVRRGTMTVADVVAVLVVVQFLARPIRVLGLAHDYWQRGRVSEQKVREFLQSSSRGFDHPELAAVRVRKGLIEFDDVSAGPLQHFTARAEAGRFVGIAGAAGGGKSTILRLVSRLQDPESGDIRIDGQSILGADERSVVRQIGFVSPDLPLLRGSVRRNVTYQDRDAELGEIQRVAFSLGLDHQLAQHLDGLGGWLTEGGSNISLGERQLISIARALVGNPPILLLDEPMLGLDAETQTRVRDVLRRYQGTVLMVSHDPRDIAMADTVWTLDEKGNLK